MSFLRAFLVPALALLCAFPQASEALSLKYQLTPHTYQDITYYYEEPVGQGDRLHGYYDPARPVSGFVILDFSDFDRESFPDGYFTPDVKRYSVQNGLRTFTHKNSYLDFGWRMKFGPKFEMELFDLNFDEYVPPGDWSTLIVANDYVESEFRYLYLPEDPDACYHGEFGLCTEFTRGISRRAVTWTVSAVPAPGAIGTLSAGLALMGAIGWRRGATRHRG